MFLDGSELKGEEEEEYEATDFDGVRMELTIVSGDGVVVNIAC